MIVFHVSVPDELTAASFLGTVCLNLPVSFTVGHCSSLSRSHKPLNRATNANRSSPFGPSFVRATSTPSVPASLPGPMVLDTKPNADSNPQPHSGEFRGHSQTISLNENDQNQCVDSKDKKQRQQTPQTRRSSSSGPLMVSTAISSQS